MTIKQELIDKIDNVRIELFGTTFDENLSAEDNYNLMVGSGGNGYIRNKIDSGLLDTEIMPGFSVSPAIKTYIDYFDKLNTLEIFLDTYFGDDGNNNNYFQDPARVDADLNPTGRAGYLHRYAIAHMDKLSFYGFWKILLKDEVEIDLIADDFYDYTEYPNLIEKYRDEFFSDIFVLTANIVYTGYGYYKWVIDGLGWDLEHTGGDIAYFSLLQGDINWSEEEAMLSSLVIEKENEVNLISNIDLRNAFALMETVKNVNPRAVIYRDLDGYKTINEFYEEKGLNEVIDLFEIGLISPDDVRL